jgi:hypothetical protein
MAPTESAKSAKSRILTLGEVAKAFPLPWSHYVLLMAARSPEARDFYEAEAWGGLIFAGGHAICLLPLGPQILPPDPTMPPSDPETTRWFAEEV